MCSKKFTVTPNCFFELDDVEKDWTWTRPFDYIFSRGMTGSFTDVQGIINKAYEYEDLTPDV